VSKKRPQQQTAKKLSEAKGAAERRSPNLEDFHCDMFNLTIPITEEGFDKDSFLKAVGVENEGEYVDEDGDISLSLPFASQRPSKQHAHIRILIYKNKSGSATLNYHSTGTKIPAKKPPYLEDCARWFGGFFKNDETLAIFTAAYAFEKGYTPTIPLPFPLVTSSEELSGLKVTGLSLKLPPDSLVDTAIVQYDKGSVFLFLQKESEIALKEFDLYEKLERLTTIVTSLVKRQGKTNDSKQTEKA
jgi:hypothetical protein